MLVKIHSFDLRHKTILSALNCRVCENFPGRHKTTSQPQSNAEGFIRSDFVLHAAGLLSGNKAATHWGSLERLRALGDVTVVEQRYTSKTATSGQLPEYLPGTNLILAFIASVDGGAAAGKVQLATEYNRLCRWRSP